MYCNRQLNINAKVVIDFFELDNCFSPQEMTQFIAIFAATCFLLTLLPFYCLQIKQNLRTVENVF